MALITPTKVVSQTTLNLVTATQTLTLSDTFVYKPGAKQVIILKNDTGSSVTVTFSGNEKDEAVLPGFLQTVDVDGGVDIVLADGAEVLLLTDQISAFINEAGITPTITSSAAGVEIALIEL